MKVAIVSGAPKAWLDIEDIKSSFIIGVDRGALILIEQGISPHVSIGDFDSVTTSELEQIKASSLEFIQLPSEKDETDTEVALNYLLTKKVSSIKLYGVIGGRIDHTLANTRLLLHFAKKALPLTLVDKDNYLTVLTPGNHEFKSPRLRYISFFALESTVSNLTLENLKYPLINYELKQDDIRCISNEALSSSFNVSFDGGYLLMIYSQD